MADVFNGITLGGFARGFDRARRTNLAAEEIRGNQEIRRQQLEQQRQQSLLNEVNGRLDITRKAIAQSNERIKAALQTFPEGPRRQEALDKMLQVREGLLRHEALFAERLGQPPLGLPNQDFMATVQTREELLAQSDEEAARKAEQERKAAVLQNEAIADQERKNRVADLPIAAREQQQQAQIAGEASFEPLIGRHPDGRTVSVDKDEVQQINELRDQGFIFVGGSKLASTSNEALGLRPQEVQGYRDQRTASLQVVDAVDRMTQQLNQSDSVTGFLGSATQITGTLVDQVTQSAELVGIDVGRDLLAKEYDFKSIPAASKSAVIRGNVTNLAFVLARAANPDGKISDADVQAQIDRIGGSSGNKEAMVNNLLEIKEITKRNFNTFHETLKLAQPNLPDIPTQLRLKTQQTGKNFGSMSDDEIGALNTNDLTGEELRQLNEELEKRLGNTR